MAAARRTSHTGKDYYRRGTCRTCGSRNVTPFLDLGRMPLAGNFPTESEVGRERRYPLRIFYCGDCALVQVLDVVSPRVLFSDYRYLSSVTATLRGHFEAYAAELARSLSGATDPFVVEIGANDGVLLEPLQTRGVRALGIEPAENVAAIAKGRGLDVWNEFFDESVAERIVASHGQASIVTASNVFAHIDDLHAIARGVATVLRPDGTFIVEVHYLRELLRLMQYDFFYHEHLCYYSLGSLIPFLRGHGLQVFDAQPIPIHAGSLRVFARPTSAAPPRSDRLVRMLARERREGLTLPSTYARFGRKVARHAQDLRAMLARLRSRGKSLAGYGAPGRGNTLLNYARIGPDLLEYIVDASPSRFGRFTPGTHIPIVPPERFEEAPPDCALMLAWSYYREIVAKERAFLRGGGRFLVPLPRLRIVS